MIRALASMNDEMEILKGEILKIVDEKTKISMLKEIDQSHVFMKFEDDPTSKKINPNF